MTGTATAQQLRQEAAAADKAAADSFDRCDTDGFLSQWAHGMTAQQKRLQATIVEQGGMFTFPGLFNRETGKRVKAKIVKCRSFNGYGTESKWIVLDENDKALAWLPAYKSSKQAKLYKMGYEERDEQAPAVADIAGSGRGLSGAASCSVYARRTDQGYPEGATVKGL